jgi:hypothetical protein
MEPSASFEKLSDHMEVAEKGGCVFGGWKVGSPARI